MPKQLTLEDDVPLLRDARGEEIGGKSLNVVNRTTRKRNWGFFQTDNIWTRMTPDEDSESNAGNPVEGSDIDDNVQQHVAPAPLARWPELEARPCNFLLLQQWEGVVEDVGSDTFTGVLCDLTMPENPRERVELELGDVSESDREMLQAGAVFYWSIGYNRSKSGQVTRVSIIKFRRTPRWGKRRLERAQRRAERLRQDLLGEDAL